jgi:hypothetical protein
MFIPAWVLIINFFIPYTVYLYMLWEVAVKKLL